METKDIEFLAWLDTWVDSDEEYSDEELSNLYEVYKRNIAA